MLAEAHPVLEDGKQRVTGMEGLGEGDRGAGAAGAHSQVEALHQPLDEVVLGKADPLVGSDAVIAQVLLAVQAV